MDLAENNLWHEGILICKKNNNNSWINKVKLYNKINEGLIDWDKSAFYDFNPISDRTISTHSFLNSN